jgi:hypothetical protein
VSTMAQNIPRLNIKGFHWDSSAKTALRTRFL